MCRHTDTLTVFCERESVVLLLLHSAVMSGAASSGTVEETLMVVAVLVATAMMVMAFLLSRALLGIMCGCMASGSGHTRTTGWGDVSELKLLCDLINRDNCAGLEVVEPLGQPWHIRLRLVPN